MDLTTTYLGLELKNPIVCGASPLVDDLDAVRQLEDAGVGAIVMRSLFEEEILQEMRAQMRQDEHAEAFAEATSYLPDLGDRHLGPDAYLDMVRTIKDAVDVPVIGSLNGSTPGGWTDYAARIQEAGADALELNLYDLATDLGTTGSQIEEQGLEVVRAVRSAVSIPVSVKLSPFYSSIASFARRAVSDGADGLVLFNRFYQPDIDVESLEMVPNLQLSSSQELRLRLRWLALLSGRVETSLSATGGVHTAVDVIKAVMAGANTVQMVSALLLNGPAHVARVLDAVSFWMSEHEYDSIRQMVGSMSLMKAPRADALERANYVKVLDSWSR
jgi:dihydroorotate dehydrogenase (fumarate)